MAFVVVLVLAAGAAAWWWMNRSTLDDLADSATVELPAVPDDPAATVEYLRGPGAPLVAAARIPDWAIDAPDRSACQTIASQLDDAAPPTALFEIASAVPDAATADMAQSYVGDALSFLDSCLAGADVESADVIFTGEVLRRRLSQLGA